MIKFIDHRSLPIAFLLPDGQVVLPDETDKLDYSKPWHAQQLPGWDAELKLYNLTGVPGADLKVLGPVQREGHRAAIKAAIEQLPRDVHAETAGQIFGKPAEEVTTDERRAAKMVNYGSIYEQPERFSEGPRLGTTKPADRIVDRLRAAVVAREAKLREASDKYHNQVPIMTDANYDTEWRVHEKARTDFPTWFDKTSAFCLFTDGTVLDRIGAAPAASSGFAKVRHSNRMLSIRDVFEGPQDSPAQFEELLAFVRDIEKKIGANSVWPLDIEDKVDGLALKLIYCYGELAMAVTRGDGEFGDDVTENVRTSGIVPLSIVPAAGGSAIAGYSPHELPQFEVIGEVYMPLAAFARANAEREAEGLDLWANPRNAAAGAIKLHDAEELKARPLAFVRHDSGHHVPGFQYVGGATANHWPALIEQVESLRHEVRGYGIDGAVIKVSSGQGREILGLGTTSPNWACAFKYRPVQALTPLEGIDVQVGRTGVLTPVGRLKPILIDGSTVSNATLNNEGFINENGFRIGDMVVLQKAGAIIPQIVSSETLRARQEELCDFYRAKYPDEDTAGTMVHVRAAISEERPPFSLVAHLGGKCPSCGSIDLQKQEVAKGEGAKWKCLNSASCPAQLATRIQHFCSRGCLDIEGIGKEASIAIAAHMGKLWEEDQVVPSPLNMFDWIQPAFAMLRWTTLSGSPMTFGPSRADKVVKALKHAKSLPLHRWIRAMGIHTVGENTSKEVSRLCLDSRELAGMVYPVSGIAMLIEAGEDKTVGNLAKFAISTHLGPVSAAALTAYFRTPTGEAYMAALANWDINSDNYDPVPVASDAKPLTGKNFVVTGTLSVSRDEIKALIEASGGKVSGSVTGKTDYLVAGEGGGKKSAEAAKKNVPTITEAALRAML